MAQTQGNIQIPHTHIAVNTQNRFPVFCQGLRNPGTQACFAGAAFTGYNCDQFAQSQALLAADWYYYKGITHKKQGYFPGITKFFHQNKQRFVFIFQYLDFAAIGVKNCAVFSGQQITTNQEKSGKKDLHLA